MRGERGGDLFLDTDPDRIVRAEHGDQTAYRRVSYSTGHYHRIYRVAVHIRTFPICWIARE